MVFHERKQERGNLKILNRVIDMSGVFPKGVILLEKEGEVIRHKFCLLIRERRNAKVDS